MSKGSEKPPRYIVIAIRGEVRTITIGDRVQIDYYDSLAKSDAKTTGVVTDVSQAGAVYGVELDGERAFISNIIKDIRVLPKGNKKASKSTNENK